MASDNPFCSTSVKEDHLSFTSSNILTMSLTCVLDLSVNISIFAVSFNAFAVLFNSRLPVFAFVLIPERLIAIDFQFCYRGAFYLLIVCRFTHPPLGVSSIMRC